MDTVLGAASAGMTKIRVERNGAMAATGHAIIDEERDDHIASIALTIADRLGDIAAAAAGLQAVGGQVSILAAVAEAAFGALLLAVIERGSSEQRAASRGQGAGGWGRVVEGGAFERTLRWHPSMAAIPSLLARRWPSERF